MTTTPIDNTSARDEHPTRPVRCRLCGGEMYYSGDPRHVPEVMAEIHGSDRTAEFYAHERCWNRLLSLNDQYIGVENGAP